MTKKTNLIFGICALAVSVAAATQALAADEKVHEFACSVQEKGKKIDFKFRLKNLDDKKKLEFSDTPGATESNGPIVFPEEDAYCQTATLNDQGGDVRLSKNKKGEQRLVLFGDGDGEVFTYLVLYADSGYTQGWVRFEGETKKESWYQKISCSNTAL